MAQSLSCLLTHVVFSTKGRTPWIVPEVRPELHAYLAGLAREAGCHCHRVGGVGDHVHIAVELSRTLAMADLVERLKIASTKWMKRQPRERGDFEGFAWQRGYGAFSLAAKDLAALVKYIDEQETHHRTMTFEEEFRKVLTKYGVEWDEAWVWD